jgi:hypothetical protein
MRRFSEVSRLLTCGGNNSVFGTVAKCLRDAESFPRSGKKSSD